MHRGYINDPTVAPFRHVRQSVAHRVQCARQVHRYNGVPSVSG